MAALEEYRRKRNFERTPEPDGSGVEVGGGQGRDRSESLAGEETAEERSGIGETSPVGGLFVVQKHDAQRLHYDLRLEQDGVLRSWAVPKGPSPVPGERRLAVQVEDHPLEYGSFEGVIPEGQYGGGTVMLWDRGSWRRTGKFTEDHLDFELVGSKLHGVWSLIRMRGGDEEGENWLLIRRSEGDERAAGEHQDDPGGEVSVLSGRTMAQIARDRDRTWTRSGEKGEGHPPPVDASSIDGARKRRLDEPLRPQLATLVDSAPDGDQWLNEIKLDGYRILAQVRSDGDGPGSASARLLSRNGKIWTDRFPHIATLLRNLPVREAHLDGEVVAYASDGSSSFRMLQEALSSGKTGELVYQVFDLLYFDGFDLSSAPLLERKRALRELLSTAGLGGSGPVRYTDHITGKAPTFFERACGLGLEGIICKRADSPYRSGRNRAWLKVKCSRHAELIIGGFTEPGGSRSGFGALLLGGLDRQGKLRYAGKVGTGFSDRLLLALRNELGDLERKKSPFADPPRERGVHWVEPRLVAEVEFTEWTRDGSLRHPTFRGLREDRDPGEIILPDEAGGGGRAAADQRSTGTGSKSTGGGGRVADDDASVAGVRLTSPDRVLYPDQGVTKVALARYYEEIAEWILPYVERRPLSLVRCPQGHEKQCFFQKHPGEGLFTELARVEIEESDGPEDYLYIRTPADLVSLVQGGVLELHVWGSRVDDVERPDMLVFDLDPAPGVPWAEMTRVARELRDRLEQLGLASFLRTTGGKGLHLVLPLRRGVHWEVAKEFARAVAQAAEADDRQRITTNMSKAKRKGKIFLDYLRNGRGATAIASYSTRAREGATIAVPVRWDELTPALRPDRYDIGNLRRRLGALRSDPWEGFDGVRRGVTKTMLKAVGVKD